MIDHYKVLGVKEDASQEEIKKAFRDLSKIYHPDKNNGDQSSEEKFKQINESYSILSDENKRREYELKRKFENDNQNYDSIFGRTEAYSAYDIYRQFFNDSDINMDDFFGNGGARQRQKKAPSLNVKIQLSFEDTYYGCKKTVSFARKVKCSKCNGTGSANGIVSQCAFCDGSGRITINQRRGPIVFSQEQECPKCNGSGVGNIEKKCSKCNGSGTEMNKTQITINFPPGVEQGNYQVLEGGGNYEPNHQVGDVVFVVSEVVNNTPYIRNGFHLVLNHVVKLEDIFGKDKIKVKHLDGTEYELDLHTDKHFCDPYVIENRGFANRGHFLVRLDLKLPKNIREEDMKTFSEISKGFTY